MQIQELQILLAIPKSIEAIFFMVNFWLVWRKYRGTPWKDRPQLNKLFLIGFLGWIFYITFDIFIYIFAPVSMKGIDPPFQVEGYPRESPSLFWMNILRDIGFFGAWVILWAYFIASYNIRYGAEKTKKVFANPITHAIMLGVSIYFVWHDQIRVTLLENDVLVNAVWDGISGWSLGITIIFFMISAVLMYRALHIARVQEESKETRRKLLYLTIGVFMMGLGDIYWWVLGALKVVGPDSFIFFLFFLGHFLWLLSPVFIYLGLKQSKVKNKYPPKTEEKEASTETTI